MFRNNNSNKCNLQTIKNNKLMNDGRNSTFIDMAKMKRNELICDERALIHLRQIDEICRIIKEKMEYGEYDPTEKFKSENDVISIFARLGAGKTTFVKSLKKMIREQQVFVYRNDGEYSIDNLAAERAIRPQTIQRKGSLFFGSVQGALRSAMYNTFIQTCKQVGVSFRQYFKALLKAVKSGRTDYENLLPMTICLD